MKKKIYFLLLFIPMFFASCSEDLDYRKAVREQNFEKAHSILNRMEDDLNDFYENNEMVQERVFTVSDYSNYHKFEKMCHNQIDAICYVYGEEMKHVASMNEPNVKTHLKFLINDAKKDAQRIVSKLSAESSSSASDLSRSFSYNMQSVLSVIDTITGEEED